MTIPSGQERFEEFSGTVFDLASKIAPRMSPDEVEAGFAARSRKQAATQEEC